MEDDPARDVLEHGEAGEGDEDKHQDRVKDRPEASACTPPACTTVQRDVSEVAMWGSRFKSSISDRDFEREAGFHCVILCLNLSVKKNLLYL